jgi:hypothetical protein
MVSTARAPDSQSMVIRPRLGTGWETTVDDLIREVWLRFKLLGLALPIRKRVPFSQVVHVAVVCRESWWSRAGAPWGFWQNFIMFGVASLPSRTPMPTEGERFDRPTHMPTKGWRYDLLMTQEGGCTTRLEVLKSSHTADDLAGQLRQRIGLPSVN